MVGVLDLDEVRMKRAGMNSRGVQSSKQKRFPRVKANIDICRPVDSLSVDSTLEKSCKGVSFHTPNEEIELAPALWMWDYLRRTKGARGFFLPLSGGADSASVAAIVASMARIVFNKAIIEKD